MSNIKFFGIVKNGIRCYYRPELHKQVLIPLEGKEFEEIIQERFIEPSQDQHAYYRGGIIAGTCMETELFQGWTAHDIHDLFGSLFLSYTKVATISGKDIEIVKTESTANLTKKKMAEFITNVIAWLAEHNIYPLAPEEYVLAKYKSQIING